MAQPTTRVDSVPRLPARQPDTHKGSYGRVLVVAGSRGMTGAAVLCGSAALRGGAGLVEVATPAEVLPTVAAGNPCYMTHGIHQHADCTYSPTSNDNLHRSVEAATAVAVGPGLGHRPDVTAFVERLLDACREKPLVIDADGLNVLPTDPGPLRDRATPAVLTPHPGEFARLTGAARAEVQADREPRAVAFATAWNAVLVLKGHRTLVTDGLRIYKNATGNPGMATGGTGDVLTGLLAALVAGGMAPFDAAVLAAWAHGRAGDRAAERFGMTALTALDVLNELPAALREKEGR